MAAADGSRVEFRLPDLGEGVHEAQVLAWNVRPGDHVEAYQPLCQVESAKAAVELTSPATGRVATLGVAEGETVHVGELLVVIAEEAAGAQARGGQAAAVELTSPGRASAEEAGAAEYWGIVGTPPTPAAAPARDEPRVLAAPFVRKLARELGVELRQVAGSGPQGRVRVADLESHLARRAPAPRVAPADPQDERIPLQGLRKRIAEHMVAAVRHAPQVTAMDLLDVTDVVHAREALRAAAEAEGVRLTYLPFIVKATVAALRAVPDANAVVDEAGEAIVRKRVYNIGVATAVPGGLVVPVLKHADQLSLLEIAREIGRLVEAARGRRTPKEDLTGGTFTITSFGGFPGSPLFATPILNSPEVGILGIGRIEPQPRVVAGAIVPRHCVGVSLTFDHRAIDGFEAASFLSVLKRYLENPWHFLL